MMVVGMPLAMSHEVLETIGGEIKTICGAWGGKETATGREFEQLHEIPKHQRNLILNDVLLRIHVNTAYFFLIDYIDSVYGLL
jgi:hypothetical protein